jgi:alginate O-acetyltransferase complex protein AlgJ
MFTGSEADQNGVHAGKDGWLFLSGGSNEALRLLTDENLFVAQDAEQWALKLLHRKEILTGLGVQYYHMWVPDKIKVYRQHLGFDPAVLTVDPTCMVRDSANMVGSADVIIDPLPALISRKEEQLLYWKTDTHWTYLGACTAYSVFCESAKAMPLEDLWHHQIQYTTLTLDLGSKLTPSVQEKLRDSHI